MTFGGSFSTSSGSAATQEIVYDNFGVIDAADDDAFVTAFATSTSPVTKSGAGLNGVVGTDTMAVPRPVTITLSNSANSYVASAITVTGIDITGATVTSQVTPSGVNGNETLETTKCFVSVTSVAFPAQGNTNGSIKVGFSAKFGLRQKPVTASGLPILLAFLIDLNPATTAEAGMYSTTALAPYGGIDSVLTPPDGGSSFMAVYVKDLT